MQFQCHKLRKSTFCSEYHLLVLMIAIKLVFLLILEQNNCNTSLCMNHKTSNKFPDINGAYK